MNISQGIGCGTEFRKSFSYTEIMLLSSFLLYNMPDDLVSEVSGIVLMRITN